MKKNLFLGILVSALPVFAGNLFFNGALDLESEGFALEKYLAPAVNPKLEFFPLKVEPDQGKQALKIDNRYGEFFILYSKEFQLKPKTGYVFRFQCRMDGEAEKFFYGLFRVDPQWFAHQSRFTADGQWKPVTLTFTTDAKAGYFHLLMRPFSRVKAASGTLYLADFSLTEVNPVPENASVEIAVKPDRKLYYRGERAKMRLLAANPGKLPYSGTLTVTVKDDYFGTTLFSEQLKLTLKGGEKQSIELAPHKLDRYGRFTISVSGPGVTTLAAPVAVIGKYEAKPFNVHQDYVVALNGGMELRGAPEAPHLSYAVGNSCFDERFELLAAMGVRLLRDHDAGIRGVDWRWLEPQPGKWDFSHLQRQLATYRKYHFTYFPVMGNGFIAASVRPTSCVFGWPEWVSRRSRKQHPAPPSCMPKVRDHIELPPEKEFREYLTRAIRMTGNDVPVYEFVNEPNLYLAPENYVRYLKIFHEVVRQEAPQSKISGFCLTSDFGAAAKPWMDRCVELGGLHCVDAIGFHPYGGRTLGAVRPADDYIQTLRGDLQSYRRPDLPLWNTELYYLIDQQVQHDSIEETYSRAHHVVCRFLVDLGEGVVQSISIPANYLFSGKRLMPHSMHYRNGCEELFPEERFVAYNTMARLFERAKPVRKYKLPQGIICYVFRKDGKLIAALWNYQKREVSADLSRFQVMDIFGNPEKNDLKIIGNAPFYLTSDRMTEAEFLAAIGNLKPAMPTPVSAGEVVRKIGNQAVLTLHNLSDRAVSGTLKLAFGKNHFSTAGSFTLPPQSSRPVALPLPDGPLPKAAEAAVIANGKLSRFPVKLVNNRKIGEKFSLPGADGTLRYGDGKITVTMTVKDGTFPKIDGEPWQSDCVELFFDLSPFALPELHAAAYTADTFRVFVTPHRKTKLQTMGRISASVCQLELKNSKDGYRFTLTIPAKTGKALGFDVKLDDSDGKNIRESTLGGGKMLYANRTNFSIAGELPPTVPAVERNLIDFEKTCPLRDYSKKYSGSCRWEKNQGFLSGRCAVVSGKKRLGGETSLPLSETARPGRTAVVSFRAKAASPDQVMRLTLDFGGKPHFYKTESFRLFPEWTCFECRCPVPDNPEKYPDMKSRKLNLRFGIPRAGFYFLDDVVLRWE